MKTEPASKQKHDRTGQDRGALTLEERPVLGLQRRRKEESEFVRLACLERGGLGAGIRRARRGGRREEGGVGVEGEIKFQMTEIDEIRVWAGFRIPGAT